MMGGCPGGERPLQPDRGASVSSSSHPFLAISFCSHLPSPRTLEGKKTQRHQHGSP